MSKAWHITPAFNLHAILVEGLRPMTGERSALLGEPEPAIYLFSDFEAIEDALSNWLGEAFDEDEELALIEVDIPAEAVRGTGAGYEIVLLSDVSPDAITVLTENLDADWDLVAAQRRVPGPAA